MDEAGHDLLAGARFAGEEDGGLGRRHLGRLGQDRLPLARVADDAVVAPGGLQLVAQRVDALFEPGGAVARLRGLALFLGEALVGQRQADVIGHAPGHGDILLRVLAGAA